VLRDWVTARDAELVVRLREAGSVLIGKANLEEFAYGPSHEFGRTNNPVDPTRTASGSSGGSAAAVGSGSVYASIGTDAGGSVRLPAALCGVVGLKPTFGQISLEGALRIAWSLEHCGTFGRCVDDARALYAAVSKAPLRPPVPLDSPPRLALVEGALEGLAPPVETGLRESLARLESAGAAVEQRSVADVDRFLPAFMVTLISEGALGLERFLVESPGLMGPLVRRTFELAVDIGAVDYVRAQRFRTKLLASVDQALQGVDALVTATVVDVAWVDDPTQDDLDLDALGDAVRWMAPFNLTGHPAITIPAISEGLPVGLQLIGRRGEDERLLDVARWAEASLRAG
jgi:aspartyl-tRNA(Asn)/glutamyl-tRNA(Gln) amidotransferase subunit A